MRVGLIAAGFLLSAALVSAASAATVTPPPNKAPAKTQAKASCPCNCPQDHKAGHQTAAHTAPHRMAHHAMRRYAGRGYYRYSNAAPLMRREWHGQWRIAPDDAFIPGPAAYGPPQGYYQDSLQVDDRSWTGGVGGAPDGGGGGGFVDGFGQVHFANGGSVENGPTYNSYGQSFQYNPSQAGPFQSRSMGGFAPPSR